MSTDDTTPVTTTVLKRELKKELQLFEKRILDEVKRYFDVAVENVRHDAMDANHDKIELIKDRVTRLEQHTGLAAA